MPSREEIIDAIKRYAKKHGRAPSRTIFAVETGITQYHIEKHFESWRDAVRSAGFEPNTSNLRIADSDLLEDWGSVARKIGHIPTRSQHTRHGSHHPGSMEIGFLEWNHQHEPWSAQAMLAPLKAGAWLQQSMAKTRMKYDLATQTLASQSIALIRAE